MYMTSIGKILNKWTRNSHISVFTKGQDEFGIDDNNQRTFNQSSGTARISQR